MTRVEMVAAIVSLHSEMRTLTVAAGVDEARYDGFIVDLDRRRDDKLTRMLEWLRETRHGAYNGVLQIWQLLPERIWATYDEWGEINLREQILLAQRRRLLKKEWRHVTESTKRVKDPEQEGDSRKVTGVAVRPEGAGANEHSG